MRRVILTIIIVTSFSFHSEAQTGDIKTLFDKFSGLFYSGDLVKAEGILQSILDSKMQMPEGYLNAIYNNLSAINVRMGRYDKALDYCIKAESNTSEGNKELAAFADICNNRAMIYNARKSFDQAIQYLDKSIRIYNKLVVNNDRDLLQNLSSAYLNIGIAYYELKKYKTATEYLEKSARLKSDNKLSGLALVFLNLAKTFTKTGAADKAEEYYLLSISEFRKEFGDDYYRLVDVFIDYSIFLNIAGKNPESFIMQRKALAICLKNYGQKHTFVSLVYKVIGDHHLEQNSCDSALWYYQRSLIAVVKNFNETNIYKNPSIDSSIFNIRLLDNLKSKAIALNQFAGQQVSAATKLRYGQAGLESIELAIQLIDRIRNSFLTEESRIYLADNEKETYMLGVQLARGIYDIRKDRASVGKMYDIVKKAKAAVLRNEISENELSYTAGIPDSLRNRRDQLSGNIAAYNNLILEEMRKNIPDTKKISLWKDALFLFNRENERIAEVIGRNYPEYAELLQKTVPISNREIQSQLNRDETVLDYLLSNQSNNGKRRLYIFILTRNRINFTEISLDSAFNKYVGIVTKQNKPDAVSAVSEETFREYTSALYYLYESLVRPAETFIRGKRVVVIPDEEIALLPFDAFLKKKPASAETDYEGLPFLIKDYAISFRYASSLNRRKMPLREPDNIVYAFSPDYTSSGRKKDNPSSLLGAGREIDTIMKLFPGKKFTGPSASKSNFMTALKQQVIFHLAMHSLSDSSDSRYSYLLFDAGRDNNDNGKLYNYEIGLSRVRSPMVVLSACNSGTGVLFHGEGLMSLARGFILAGASSVVKTSWEVNDETSAIIIGRFYYYLSKGKNKDEALQLAKLEYIGSRAPVYGKPYYWAAYEVLGDNSGLVEKPFFGKLILMISLVVAIPVMIYLRWRRISFARSL
jgi:CHAT domain-containing protein